MSAASTRMSTAAYRIVENARLDARNTFGVQATAPLLVEVADASALPDLFGKAMPDDCPALVLGGGSNLLFAGDPAGVVLALTAQRIGIRDDDGARAIVRADAGVGWHDLVLWTLGHGLCGLENLALIPGTVGAAPIQNIGAYGVEVCDRIHAVEAFDRPAGAFVRFAAADCAFAYRESLFKRDPGRYIVTAVEFALAAAPLCASVTAVDVSPVMLDRLRAKAAQASVTNLHVVEAGFLSYQHENEPVDFVYSRWALHHLPDFWKALALARIRPVLRSGGVFRLLDIV